MHSTKAIVSVNLKTPSTNNARKHTSASWSSIHLPYSKNNEANESAKTSHTDKYMSLKANNDYHDYLSP
jgi:hypothetical protein